ncbi:MAG: dihydroorotate dehydrogenase (quinone) [Gammaproteobacteria bacterium]|nr:dihydroorotate dehydrogenase (quinone) [Gammaproteobacteria bacterium]
MYALARPGLFALEPERAHELTLAALARLPAVAQRMMFGEPAHAPLEFCGLRLRNRVGLAAGLDKDGVAIAGWMRMGFGFVELGTVTPRPQPGNPPPRLFRLPSRRALINRMGFNNAGVNALAERLRRAPREAAIGVNLGKNADTPLARAIDDYRLGLEAVYSLADYITVNLSSPNTAGLRELQERDRFEPLLRELLQTRDRLADRHGRYRPLLVKLAPDLADAEVDRLADAAATLGVDGLIATNTTVMRPGLEGCAPAAETGGLSGAPLAPLAERVLRRLRLRLGPSYPLVGVGGILSGEDAARRREAGADVLQIYTGLIYRGPTLVREVASVV